LTPASGQVSWTDNTEFVLNHYLHRSIDQKILDLQNEVIVNPQSVYLLSLEEDEPVGIELVSLTFSQLLRQLFVQMWGQAKVVDERGGD